MEPRQLHVLHDGRWLPGWLLAARQDPGGPGAGWSGTGTSSFTPELG